MKTFCYLPRTQTAYSDMTVINWIAVEVNTKLENLVSLIRTAYQAVPKGALASTGFV